MTGIETMLAGAVAAVAGALVFVWKIQLKTYGTIQVDLKVQLEKLEKKQKNLEEQNKCLAEKVHLLERENSRLLTQFIALSSAHDSSPLPQWVKDENGKMLSLNRAYEKTFLIPNGLTLKDCLHKADRNVWPEEIAEAFRKSDDLVWKTRKIHDLKEPISVNGKITYIRTIKYPRYAEGIKDPIGISGIAIPDDLAL